MKVFMFISGRSYGNSLKYKAFYVCMSFMLMALFSTIFTAKPAFATDNPTSIDHGSVKCPDGYVPRQDGDSDWWGCSQQGIFGGQGAFVGGVDLVITCTAGWKAVFTTKTGTTTVGVRVPTPINYKLGHCVEEPKSVVEKNAEALADKAGQDSLVTLISPKIEDSPWYLGLSDADKVTAGCKWQKADVDVPGSPGKILTCNNDARQKLAKMLIGTCIADAVKTIAARTNGDTGSSAMDAVFTSCLAGHSGVDEASIKAQKGEIAWNDIKEDVDISGSAATEESKADEAKNSCGIDGIGWFICPLMNFASNISDSAYSAISQFLSIDPKIFKNDSTSGGLKQAWNFFRDIANAVFAVIFLWVIFSQISNVGVSNYGIKKILPRLIIGALLVNLSFYLCQLAVDLSNILGFSLKGVLERAASEIDTQSAAAGSFYTVVVGALALTGAVLFLFLAVSIPTITALLLALLVVLVILIVRQAAIILLIAVSPLAFAAWLLPNTENLFKKWISMFKGLLVVFPVVSLLYGAGKLAGAILAASATDDPNNPKETMQFAALAASILPLGATPFVLKSSLNSLGSFAGKLGGLSGLANKKLGGAIGNSIGNSRLNDLKKGWQKNSAKRQANRRSGNTWLGRKADALRGSNSRLAKGAGIMLNPRRALDNSWLGRATGLSEGAARSQAISDELFENEVKGQALALRGMTSSEIATIAKTGKTSTGKEVSRSMHAATIDHTMANGSFNDRVDVYSSLAGKDAAIKNRVIKAGFAKGDNNILGNRFGDAILEDKVGNMTDLENLAIDNAADGNLQAEHLVQNAAGTDWLVEATINAGSKKTNANYKAAKAAESNIKSSASTARSNPNTAKNINGKLDSTFRKVGA